MAFPPPSAPAVGGPHLRPECARGYVILNTLLRDDRRLDLGERPGKRTTSRSRMPLPNRNMSAPAMELPGALIRVSRLAPIACRPASWLAGQRAAIVAAEAKRWQSTGHGCGKPRPR